MIVKSKNYGYFDITEYETITVNIWCDAPGVVVRGPARIFVKNNKNITIQHYYVSMRDELKKLDSRLHTNVDVRFTDLRYDPRYREIVEQLDHTS